MKISAHTPLANRPLSTAAPSAAPAAGPREEMIFSGQSYQAQLLTPVALDNAVAAALPEPPAAAAPTSAAQSPVASAPIQLALWTSAPEFPLLESRDLRLDKLGGQPKVREELGQLVDALKEARTPPFTSYLIEGNAGQGKTSWLRALAGELYPLGISSLHADGADFVENGPAQVKKLFAEACQLAQNSPSGYSVIALDDVEPLTRIRSGDANAVSVQQHQLLATFCEQMDQAKNVIVVATASRSNTMDLEGRARFQHSLGLQTPADKHERLEVLQSLIRQQHQNVAPEVLQEIAAATAGSSPADLKEVLRLAELRGGPAGVTSEAAREARLEKAFGPAQAVNNPDWMFRLTVLHELGHVVTRHVFEEMAGGSQHPDHMPKGIDAVSFAPRGEAAAAVFLKPSGNPASTFEWYFAEVSSNLAGRAAENQFGDGHLSGGPGSDIRFATSLIQEAVRQKGMGQRLGPINPEVGNNPEFLQRAQEDEERLSKAADEVAASVVHFYKPVMEEIAQEFLANKNDLSKLTISGDELKARFRAWEQAEPQRPGYVGNLHTWIRTTMDSLRYRQPAIFDPISQQMLKP